MSNHDTAGEQHLLQPHEAARRLAVSVRTLTRMAERGQVAHLRLPSGHRRYDAQAIEALRQTQEATAA